MLIPINGILKSVCTAVINCTSLDFVVFSCCPKTAWFDCLPSPTDCFY